MTAVRCIEGRLWRHDPQFDDPYLETDVGSCPDCDGDGCDVGCSLGVGCDEAGTCYAEVNGQPERCALAKNTDSPPPMGEMGRD